MVTLLELLTGIGVTVVGGLVLKRVWKGWEDSIEEKSQQQEWYADTVSFCEQGLQALRNHQNTRHPNYDEARMEMRSCASQLSRHAGDSAGLDVDDKVVECVRKAADSCQSVQSAQTYIGDTEEWDTAIAEAESNLENARDLAEDRIST